MSCGIEEECEGFDMGSREELGVKRKSLNKKRIEEKVFVIGNDNGEYLVEKGKEKVVNGMWEFGMREERNGNDVICDDLGKSMERIKEGVFKLKDEFSDVRWEIKV
ncbi:hypothetical protein [Staphylococcus epidermidis]|uniref:hypothetical protein n=1 Tax=Staphylococcus epidermidis TaxID=1282 RepID=UPI0011A10A47|nr:hypothetical protein [Staphylococcus epidermidis]